MSYQCEICDAHVLQGEGICDKCVLAEYGDESEQAKARGIGLHEKKIVLPKVGCLAPCYCDGSDKKCLPLITFKTKEFNPPVGSLMFPEDYRELRISDLTKKSYQKFRRDYNIKGRVKLLIHTGLDETAKQNKTFTYEYAHCVDQGWEGAVYETMWVTHHPYGEIIVVK